LLEGILEGLPMDRRRKGMIDEEPEPLLARSAGRDEVQTHLP